MYQASWRGAVARTSPPALLPEQLPTLLPQIWCQVFAFIMRSPCQAKLRAVSIHMCQLMGEPLSWSGATACFEVCRLNEARTLPYSCLDACSSAFFDMKGSEGKKRHTAAQTFELLSKCINKVQLLSLSNWFFSERHGLPLLYEPARLQNLQHLELCGCDTISCYEVMIPVFRCHPQLLSLKASFAPKATATASFAEAVPSSIETLGFISFASTSVLSALLARCKKIRHLWLSSTGSHLPDLAKALASHALLTVSLPSATCDLYLAETARACVSVELLCRMRVSQLDLSAEGFEVLEGSGGVVYRRHGSNRTIAPNGALWAPYSLSKSELYDVNV